MRLDIEQDLVIDFDPFVNEKMERLYRLKQTLNFFKDKENFNSLFVSKDQKSLHNPIITNLENEIGFLVADITKDCTDEEV